MARRSVASGEKRGAASGEPRKSRASLATRPWPLAGGLARAILIASSTGGPLALRQLLPDLYRRVDLPALIVQHMPPRFTRSLADSLSGPTGRPVVEAADGMLVRHGTAYVAPGGKHLLLRAGGGELRTGVNEQPPENHCRPSADVLFRTAAAALGGEAVAVMLTGMGCDGTAGVRSLKRAGAYVIAQDEATSVVWGMPGSVVRAGLADEVLPLGDIAAAVQALVGRREAP